MSDLKQQILDAVEQGWEDQLAFTQAMVRHPSIRGQEHTVQEFVFQALRERGYAMDRWAVDVDEIRDHPGFSPVDVSYENAINVVGTHRPREVTGRSLVLNGHIDVVPVGPHDMWTRPPFDPAIEGDWMYGRGGADMKAGVAANIFAMDALRRCGVQPAATVYLETVTEEECTGNGALSALVRGYTADAVLIPEPMDDSLVRANVGVLWFQIDLRGKPVHVREAGSGSNAILSAWPIITALKELEARWNAKTPNVRHFEDTHHPINLNIGKIAGGDWASSVPAWCRLDCRISIFPGEDPAAAADEIEQAIRAAAAEDPFLSNSPPTVTFNGFHTRGYVQEEGTDAEAALDAAYRDVYGIALPSRPSTAYLDGRVFALYADMPTLVFGPYSENIHGFDERLSLASLNKVTKTIALFIADWCGVEPTPGA
ncbi:MAG: ArgE/DapE family deacylase [Pseudomonadota bacterium]